VPLSILHVTSPKGPHPFLISLPSRKDAIIAIYVFVPPKPVDLEDNADAERERQRTGEWKVPVVLDFHGGGFIMYKLMQFIMGVAWANTDTGDRRWSKHRMPQ
jgi:ATP-dependent RNA helicase DDX3X